MFGLALIELIFGAALCLMLVVGTAFDRRGRENVKWWILLVGLGIIIIWFWDDLTFRDVYAAVTSQAFWVPIVAYVGIGLCYSVLEFILEVRRSARSYKESWEKQLVLPRNDEQTLKVLLASADSSQASRKAAQGIIDTYIYRYNDRTLINLVRETSKLMPEPKVDKALLSKYVGSWTFFWPFYALSLIFGDLLTTALNAISSFLISVSSRIVKMAFSDVFKV